MSNFTPGLDLYLIINYPPIYWLRKIATIIVSLCCYCCCRSVYWVILTWVLINKVEEKHSKLIWVVFPPEIFLFIRMRCGEVEGVMNIFLTIREERRGRKVIVFLQFYWNFYRVFFVNSLTIEKMTHTSNGWKLELSSVSFSPFVLSLVIWVKIVKNL